MLIGLIKKVKYKKRKIKIIDLLHILHRTKLVVEVINNREIHGNISITW